ncbi:hypothetical protein P4O66_016534, partial [Electrophorus voltai]
MAEQLYPSLTSPSACNGEMQWCKARRHWTLSSRDVFSGLINHTSPFGNPVDKSGFCGCQENGAGLSPLLPVKGTFNALAYHEILDNFMLPTLWEQFGDGPFLFQHDCAPVHKQ